MPNLTQAVAAVYVGRFVKLLIDRGDCAEIDDGIPADIAPDIHQKQRSMEVFGFHQIKSAAVAAEPADDLIENAGVRRQNALQHGDNNDAGEEMRQIGNRLRQLFIAQSAHLVEQQRKDDREGKFQNALDKADM